MRADNRKLILPVAVGTVVVLVLLAVGGYLLDRSASKPDQSGFKGQTVEELLGIGDGDEALVNFEDKWYQYNPDVEAYLFVGVDKEGKAQASSSYNGGGQADVLFLLVLDKAQSFFHVLQINRDTITEVEVLGVRGDVVGTDLQQIALAHYYGDGMKNSCENTVRAVTNFLYGAQIDGYASIQMDAIPVLNDMVGGVTVKVEDDFSQVDPTLVQGETVTLSGDQALHFIRGRSSVGDGSNISRMGRHRTYLHGFDQAMGAAMKDDPELILKLYAEVQNYMVTDMGSGTASRIAQQCQSYENKGIVTIEGEARLGEKYMEFYPDEASLMRTVLELFYREIPAG